MIHVFSIRLDLSYFYTISIQQERERDLISGRKNKKNRNYEYSSLFVDLCVRENEIWCNNHRSTEED